jgi:hypothetical protein
MEDIQRLERLLHEIQNNLQVIRMELLKEATSEQTPQAVLQATQDIEKLLEQVRQHFMLPR